MAGALALLRPRRALVLAAALVVLSPVLRVALYVLVPELRPGMSTGLHAQADALLVGAGLALLLHVRPELHARLLDAIARFRLAPVALVVLLVNQVVAARLGGAYELPIGWSVEGATIAVLIAAASRPGRLQTWLSTRILTALGLISYSLYLWQQLFLSSVWKTGVLADPLAALAFSLLAATASRVLVELPCERWKSRLTRTLTDKRSSELDSSQLWFRKTVEVSTPDR